MASSGFQFKAFYVRHDKCAMKVGTDSIILGSWAQVSGAKRVLDIGTGSGLLALMMAQKTGESTQIHAIEPEPNAHEQALENVANSPWANKLLVQQAALEQLLSQESPHQYDVIIANPPYYQAHQPREADSHLHKMTDERKTARQTDSLSIADLLHGVAMLLSDDGCFYCVLPVEAEALLTQAAALQGLCISACLNVQTTVKKKVKRQCWRIVKTAKESVVRTSDEQLVIHGDDGAYSANFKRLCSSFYLNF